MKERKSHIVCHFFLLLIIYSEPKRGESHAAQERDAGTWIPWSRTQVGEGRDCSKDCFIFISGFTSLYKGQTVFLWFCINRRFSFETFCLQEPEQGVWKIKFRFVYPLPFKTFWSKLKASLLSPQRVFQGCQGFERRSWIWSLRVCSTKGWLFKICKCMQFR